MCGVSVGVYERDSGSFQNRLPELSDLFRMPPEFVGIKDVEKCILIPERYVPSVPPSAFNASENSRSDFWLPFVFVSLILPATNARSIWTGFFSQSTSPHSSPISSDVRSPVQLVKFERIIVDGII